MRENSGEAADRLSLSVNVVTLSTLGYGDIVAVTRASRSLSALEAVVGQLYVAVVVARLIGLHLLAKRDVRI